MKYWIIPANPNTYRLSEVLKDRKIIDWRQHNNIEIGDIIYIYVSRPFSQIIYKMEVIDTDIPSQDTIADRKYWVKPSDYDTSLNNNRFFRIKAISENLTEKLTLEDLHEHGLRGVPQGAQTIKEPLLSYILKTF